MNTKIIAAMSIATTALIVACAPANARTSYTYSSQGSSSSGQSNGGGTRDTKAQLPTNSRVVDFSFKGGNFSVELKGCERYGKNDINTLCTFIFTNKSSNDFRIGGQATWLFRVFDSSGTVVNVGNAAKGNARWDWQLDWNFAAQLPTKIYIGFNLPSEDTEVTYLDLIGEKVIRFGQIPVETK
jgi:hypothetical protein